MDSVEGSEPYPCKLCVFYHVPTSTCRIEPPIEDGRWWRVGLYDTCGEWDDGEDDEQPKHWEFSQAFALVLLLDGLAYFIYWWYSR